MSKPESSLDPVLAVKLCDEFESSWSADRGTSFRPFLRQVEKAQRIELFRMLMGIEIERRNAVGQEVDPNDYRKYGEEAFQLVQDLVDTGPCWGEVTEAHQPKPPAIPSHFKGQKIGLYKLVRKIGEGGMGSVWKAEQSKPVQRKVAIKLIRADIGSKSVLARFDAERQALAMMEHPNIAKILDVGTTDSGTPYFVMELVKGLPINEYCDKHQLSIQERLSLMISVCKAVQHAHQKGIIHRDLKPSNILVHLEDGKPAPKVIDFGLAKALDQSNQLTDKTLHTEMGNVVGTIQYMSPEQASLNAMGADVRSDIYSLGVVLFELLVGSTPIDRATVKQNPMLKVLELIREKEPPRPSERLKQSKELQNILANRQIQQAAFQQALKSELDWVVVKALEIDPNRRYESAYQLARELRAYISGEAIEVRPPSMLYQFGKLVRKNRLLFGGVATTAVLILFFLIITSFLALRATDFYVASEQATSDIEAAKKITTQSLLAKNDALARSEKIEAELNKSQKGKALLSPEIDGETALQERDRALTLDRQTTESLNQLNSQLLNFPKEAEQLVEQLEKARLDLAAAKKIKTLPINELLNLLIPELPGATDEEAERLVKMLEELPLADVKLALQEKGIDVSGLAEDKTFADVILSVTEFAGPPPTLSPAGTWIVDSEFQPYAGNRTVTEFKFRDSLPPEMDIKTNGAGDYSLTMVPSLTTKKRLVFSSYPKGKDSVYGFTGLLGSPKAIDTFLVLTRFGDEIHLTMLSRDLQESLGSNSFRKKGAE